MSLELEERKLFGDLIRYGGDFYPGVIAAAQGVYVTDEAGNRVLDFTSGQMCATVGHNHPNVVRAIHESCESALHLFSGMIARSVVDLAAKLKILLPEPLSKSLFVNTGGESNEAALKLAKLYSGGHEVIALGGSWHGVTGAAAGASYASDRKGYGPAMPGMFVIPEPNSYRCPVKHCRTTCDMTCMRVGFDMYDMQTAGTPACVIVEPVLSAGGVIVPPDGYFQKLREECGRRGLLLVFDEAQTAFGRLGAWFASDIVGVVPDILTVSKTLGGGLPLAATITSDAIEDRCHERGFTFYTSHVSDPLPSAVGLAVIATIESENLLEQCAARSTYLFDRLRELQAIHEEIGDVRGRGLLIGVELVKDRETREAHHELGGLATQLCMQMGLSMNIRRRKERGAVWRIAPPLTVKTAEIDRAIEILDCAVLKAKNLLGKSH